VLDFWYAGLLGIKYQRERSFEAFVSIGFNGLSSVSIYTEASKRDETCSIHYYSVLSISEQYALQLSTVLNISDLYSVQLSTQY